MASLTGTKIKDTYDSLLKVSDNGALDGTLQTITDGLGNNSALSLSTAGASVGGTLAVSGAATFSGALNGTISTAAQPNITSVGTLSSLTTSGNVGVGVALSDWAVGASFSALQTKGVSLFGNAGSAGGILMGNTYLNSSVVPTYTQDGAATWYNFQGGEHIWYNAPSGTSGTTATLTERMRIKSGGDISFRDSSANEAFYWDASAASLGIGTSSPAYLITANSSAPQIGCSVSGTSALRIAADGTQGYIFEPRNLPLTFSTNATERMRITSVGSLKASTNGTYLNSASVYHELRQTTDGQTIGIFSNTGATTPYGIEIRYTAASPNSTTNAFFECSDSTELKFLVWSNGNVVNRNNSYGAISDAKLKENVVDASPKLEDLMQVKVRNFNYIGDDKKQLGVVAQELEQVFPSMIDESPDYEEVEVPQLDENGQEVLDENGEVVMTKEKVDLGTVTKSVKYSVFVPMLIKAIQELNAKVESLEAQLNA